MKKPCFEHQATDSVHYDPEKEKAYWDGNRVVVTPEVSKAFYKEAKAWSDSGLTFSEILDQMERTRGLRRGTIANIIKADKTAARMTDEMWYRIAKHREIKRAAEHMLVNANIPAWANRISDAWNFSRALETAYHGGVIPFSHALSLALKGVREAGIWGGIVKDAYRYAPFPFRAPSAEAMEAIRRGDFRGAMKAVGRGEAAWAQDMDQMVGSDDWIDAVRHGVEAHPADAPVGILNNISKGWGIRTFDALKKGRVRLYQLWKRQLPDFDDNSLRMLANEVNISTGTIKMSEAVGRIAGAVSFAPKVTVTRRLDAFTPIRYAWKAGRMTQTERSVMNLALRKWAKHTAVTAGLLVGNDQFNEHFTKSKLRVNFYDFMNPGTLWRMNIGGHIIPVTPMVEAARLPVAMAAALFLFRRELHGESAYPSRVGELLGREILNALHPSLIHIVEGISGREAFGVPRHQRRLPSFPIPGTDRRFPGLKQFVRGEEPERDKPMGWAEYALGEWGPIPMQDAVKEVFSPALTQEGVPRETADKWVMALLSSALSGFAGKHTFEQSPQAAPQKTRYKRPPGTLKATAPGTLR